MALDQREVALLELPFAQQLVQRAQRAALAGDEQAAAGVPIQPVHELQGLIGTQRAQRLDHAVAQAAAAVNRDARGLVEHDEPLVL